MPRLLSPGALFEHFLPCPQSSITREEAAIKKVLPKRRIRSRTKSTTAKAMSAQGQIDQGQLDHVQQDLLEIAPTLANNARLQENTERLQEENRTEIRAVQELTRTVQERSTAVLRGEAAQDLGPSLIDRVVSLEREVKDLRGKNEALKGLVGRIVAFLDQELAFSIDAVEDGGGEIVHAEEGGADTAPSATLEVPAKHRRVPKTVWPR